MKMKGLRVALGLFLLLGAGGVFSCRSSAGLPSARELDSYFDGLLRRAGLPPEVKKEILTDTVISDGLKLHLTIFPGPTGAPAVVFVPGTSIYALAYAEFMYKLSRRGFSVIGFDPRGHGLSEGKRGSYTIPELVGDTETVINYTREKYSTDIFLAGSSQGGIVAFYTAAVDHRLRGAVCHNIADLADPDSVRLTSNPTLSRVVKPLLGPLARLLPDFPVPISLYLDLSKEKTKFYGDARKFIDQDPLALKSISLKAMASLGHAPLPVAIEKIPTPIMVLHGEKDLIFPLDYVQKIYRRLPEPKRFYLAPGRPHLLLIDYVDEVLPPVEEWMREMMARPAPQK
ncbi:MAG: alpha/beta fold hydrolase [Proteobacteria bacterium]|nr:alpha/beta fold hydrolase [Pseudomonadota bacterium]